MSLYLWALATPQGLSFLAMLQESSNGYTIVRRELSRDLFFLSSLCQRPRVVWCFAGLLRPR